MHCIFVEQIHVQEDGTIKIYSRNQEDNTSKYPDIIDDIRTTFKAEVKSCILDAEAVAWDRELKKIMPFQILSTRKRKVSKFHSLFCFCILKTLSLLFPHVGKRTGGWVTYLRSEHLKCRFVTQNLARIRDGQRASQTSRKN